MRITSDAQRRLFGAIASGSAKTTAGPKPAKARLMLRENAGQMRDLPARAPARNASRVSRRGGR